MAESYLKRVIVVGGGVSGLAAAHRLVELGEEKNLALEILLLEAGPRLGGAVLTERVDGFLVEAGPDSFIREKPWAFALCERLGLGPRLISTNPSRQTVLVVRDGRLAPLPEGFLLMAPTRLWPLVATPLFSWSGKLRMAAEYFLPRGGAGDESLASFVGRRFGREALERVVQPLVGGIYAADPEKLSLAATMPRFLEMERSGRSVIRGMLRAERGRKRSSPGSGARWSLFVSLAGGMQELVDALAGRLPAGSVRLETHAVGLAHSNTKKSWIVTTNRGEALEADAVVVATPAHATAALTAAVAPELARELREISYGSTATVTLAYRESDVPRALGGFGLIAPAAERRKILACTFSSVKFPGRAPAGHVLLRAFVGGALEPGLFDQDDRAMEGSVRRELAELLGITAEPLFCRIYRHPRSMPQYHVGHLEKVARIEARVRKFPGLALAGSAYQGVGISDCVHSGETAAESLLEVFESEEGL